MLLDISSRTYKDVIVGSRVTPTVVESVEGAPKAVEEIVIDILSDGSATSWDSHVLPDWTREQIKAFSPEELLSKAREKGGRIVLSRQPPPDIERVSHAAGFVTLEDVLPFYNFSVSSPGPLRLDRAYAVEVA